MEQTGTRFYEEQRFRQTWLWILILGVTLLAWYSAIVQLFLGRPVGNHPGSDQLVLILWIGFGFLFPWVFQMMRLETWVGDEGLHFRFFPLHLRPRTILFGEIQSAEAVTYRPLLDYGGWGIRYGRGGKAYNVSGNRGVQLVLKSGKRILLGSGDPERFVAAIRDTTGGGEITFPS